MESDRISEKLQAIFATSTTEGLDASLHYFSNNPPKNPSRGYLVNPNEPESGYRSHVDLLKGVDVRSLSRKRRTSSKSSFTTHTLNQRDSGHQRAQMATEKSDSCFLQTEESSNPAPSQNINRYN